MPTARYETWCGRGKSQLRLVFREARGYPRLTERGLGAEYGLGLEGVDPILAELWQVAGYDGLFQLWFLNHYY